ncbi:FAD:protein FMN transferase [uncultured Pseudodesulfovibrio sp.]|uniref:FAD:protein FMN transferase n=1 Tax=uncultured Pseudodesulfovibrio sp. TaxID=2035858 RepID=UPI0029C804E7|nr:FAD:protein FMN transferase [uncultured Pseudodesulfovibrio sp.]
MGKKQFSRRDMLRIAGTLALGTACLPTTVSAAIHMVDSVRLDDQRYKVSETRFLMGTFVSVTAVHESEEAARLASDKAFGEIDRLCLIFDRHKTDTPISLLNTTGRLGDVSPELLVVAKKAIDFSRVSGGAFDSTVLPVVSMLKNNAPLHGRLSLSDKNVIEALDLVDSEAVSLSSREIRFEKQGMGMTLDGIGKGFIVDRASDVLVANGVTNHLINAGGDIRSRGRLSSEHPWTIAIEDPAKKGHYPAVIELEDAAVATSGGYEVYYDRQRSSHHVINPRTARSPMQSVSVSVTAPTAVIADVMSTAAFVMPPKSGIRFINNQKGSEGLIVGHSGNDLGSRNWGRLLKKGTLSAP